MMSSPSSLPLVVCVDDNEDILMSVARCIKREQLVVRTTLSACEALSWIAAEEVAVLVSDYEMPEMTGAQLAAAARRARPETVRILLTGKRTFETAVDGINNGEIFKFISKPFDNDTVRTAVLDAIARNAELLALSGDRQRRERRTALRAALEAEYPGISAVKRGDAHDVPADPWTEAAQLGLLGLTKGMEQ